MGCHFTGDLYVFNEENYPIMDDKIRKMISLPERVHDHCKNVHELWWEGWSANISDDEMINYSKQYPQYTFINREYTENGDESIAKYKNGNKYFYESFFIGGYDTSNDITDTYIKAVIKGYCEEKGINAPLLQIEKMNAITQIRGSFYWTDHTLNLWYTICDPSNYIFNVKGTQSYNKDEQKENIEIIISIVEPYEHVIDIATFQRNLWDDKQ